MTKTVDSLLLFARGKIQNVKIQAFIFLLTRVNIVLKWTGVSRETFITGDVEYQVFYEPL